MQYSKDTYNTNITEKLVELLNENIKGFRDIDWWSRSKRYGKTMDAKTIKYELCVMISDMYFGHELKHRDDGLYYSIHWKRAKDLFGRDYRKYLDLVFRTKGGARMSSWGKKDGSTLRWRLKDEVIDLCDKAYRQNKDVRRLIDKKGKVMTSWIDYAVSQYNEKSEFGKKVDAKYAKELAPFVGLNKINCTLASHMFSDIYKYKTGRLGYSDIEKWLGVLDNIDANIDDDLRLGTDRLLELHTSTIEIWGQINIDIIGDGNIGMMYKERNTGRLYGVGKGNIQNKQKELRTMLLSGMGYYDYDMENAHYTILGQYYKMISGRTLSAVNHYTKNTKAVREAISLNTGIRYEIVKRCLLGIVYGAKIDSKSKIMNGAASYTDIYNAIHKQTKQHKTTELLFRKLQNNKHVQNIWKDVDDAYRWIRKSWKVRYKGSDKERMINMRNKSTYTKELNSFGKYQYKSKGRLLSHFLQGIEAKILLEIMVEEGNGFVLALHDGWVSRINWDVKELEQKISQWTRKHLLEYNGIKDAFVIKISKDELTEVVEGDWIETLSKKGILEEIG